MKPQIFTPLPKLYFDYFAYLRGILKYCQCLPISVVGSRIEAITRAPETEPLLHGGYGVYAVHMNVKSPETVDGLRERTVYALFVFVLRRWVALEAYDSSSRVPSIHWVDKTHITPVNVGW